MPSGVYVRTELQSENQRQHALRLHKLPRSKKQLKATRKMGLLSNKGREGTVFGDDIIEHHNDLCHGAERPDDVTYMTSSKHWSLHNNVRVQNGTHNLLRKNRS